MSSLRLKNSLSWLGDKPGAMLEQLSHTTNGCSSIKKPLPDNSGHYQKYVRPRKISVKACSPEEVINILSKETNINRDLYERTII